MSISSNEVLEYVLWSFECIISRAVSASSIYMPSSLWRVQMMHYVTHNVLLWYGGITFCNFPCVFNSVPMLLFLMSWLPLLPRFVQVIHQLFSSGRQYSLGDVDGVRYAIIHKACGMQLNAETLCILDVHRSNLLHLAFAISSAASEEIIETNWRRPTNSESSTSIFRFLRTALLKSRLLCRWILNRGLETAAFIKAIHCKSRWGLCCCITFLCMWFCGAG